MTPSILTVTKISGLKSDKKDKTYKTISVRTANTKEVTGVTVVIEPKETSFNAWEENYLPPPKTDFGYNLKIGDNILGNIVTRDVAPYTIADSDGVVKQENLTIASVLVLGDDTLSDWENLVKKAFKAKNFTLMSEVKNPVVASSEFEVV